jgi:hypothetical protein
MYTRKIAPRPSNFELSSVRIIVTIAMMVFILADALIEMTGVDRDLHEIHLATVEIHYK